MLGQRNHVYHDSCYVLFFSQAGRTLAQPIQVPVVACQTTMVAVAASNTLALDGLENAWESSRQSVRDQFYPVLQPESPCPGGHLSISRVQNGRTALPQGPRLLGKLQDCMDTGRAVLSTLPCIPAYLPRCSLCGIVAISPALRTSDCVFPHRQVSLLGNLGAEGRVVACMSPPSMPRCLLGWPCRPTYMMHGATRQGQPASSEHKHP
ncbi:hypothetical protein EDB81DRAFT_403716 [Dactylonectria macrodidyma]|uniref:Uncharacterized protein n=1 Tax=Dactylonectria macrodidyma TaxID=307937 RepID=A0A9P9FBD5_9HYPO|nr:hypothetical protein EDB81DRAFT_403716 [Dactylonectria macrodidyma]